MKEDQYRTSRVCYIVEAAAEYFISIMITGTFLAKLTQTLGFSDSLTALLTSFVSLGCSVQIIAIAFFRSGKVKTRVTIAHMLNQLFFMMVYLIPFIPLGIEGKTVLFAALLLGGYFISNLIAAPKINWFMSLIDDKKRGVFTSLVQTISLVGGMVFQLVMGNLIDRYEARGELKTALILCAVVIFVLMVIHSVSLILAKEKKQEERVESKNINFSVKIQKDLIKVILITVFWTVIDNVARPFFGTYQVKELGFNMTFVAILSATYSLVRVPCAFFFGRYADRSCFAKMLRVCYVVALVSFIFGGFTVPENGRVFFTAYYLLNAMAMGGIGIAQNNLILDYVPMEQRKNLLAIQGTIGGLAGFFTTLALTPLVTYIQGKGNMLLGVHIYAQQLLSMLAALLTGGLIWYVTWAMKKIKPIK